MARSRRCRRLCASLGEGAEGPARAASGALAPERAGGAGRGGAPAGAARGAPPAAPAPLGGLCKRARCIAAQTRNNALPCGWWRNHSASVASRHASRTPANWGEPGGGHGGCAAAMASQQQQMSHDVRNGITRLGKAPSKASSPLAHQFCVFLSSSSARCCPAVPEPLLEPSTWPGAVIIGVRALALAPYLEPRGVYFILVLSSRARRPRTTREVRASHPAPALACA